MERDRDRLASDWIGSTFLGLVHEKMVERERESLPETLGTQTM